MSHTRFSINTARTGSNTGTQGSLRTLVAVAAISMLSVVLTFNTAAFQPQKKVVATFNAPVELPGKALPAGTYVFKVLDNIGSRDIVQVLDKDEKQVLATVIAIPDYRDTPPDKPIINFEERSSNTPPALKAVYFPGDTYGVQFVYPHDRAVQIAKRTGHNVLSVGNEMTPNMTAPATSAGAPSVQQLENTEVTGVTPSGGPVEVVIIVGSKPEK